MEEGDGLMEETAAGIEARYAGRPQEMAAYFAQERKRIIRQARWSIAATIAITLLATGLLVLLAIGA
jgi:hypothetical protein